MSASPSPDKLEMMRRCIELSNAAIALCDAYEEHGDEAPWDDLDTFIALVRAYEHLISPIKQLAEEKLREAILARLDDPVSGFKNLNY
jgi:hypothetical protein